MWLVSDTFVPAEIAAASPDRRALGVCIAALTLDDGFDASLGVALDDPRLCVGFHEIERDGDASMRWTAGHARLPASLWEGLDDDTFLRVELPSQRCRAGWRRPPRLQLIERRSAGQMELGI